MEKQKNWFRKHPVLATIIGLLVICIIVGIVSLNQKNNIRSDNKTSVIDSSNANASKSLENVNQTEKKQCMYSLYRQDSKDTIQVYSNSCESKTDCITSISSLKQALGNFSDEDIKVIGCLSQTEIDNIPTWHKAFEVKTASGSKTTDTFSIKGDKFKVYFYGQVDGDSENYAIANIYVYRPGDKEYIEYSSAKGCNEFDENFTFLCGNVQEFYVYEKGEFYLKVDEANINYWFVNVEDYY